CGPAAGTVDVSPPDVSPAEVPPPDVAPPDVAPAAVPVPLPAALAPAPAAGRLPGEWQPPAPRPAISKPTQATMRTARPSNSARAADRPTGPRAIARNAT